MVVSILGIVCLVLIIVGVVFGVVTAPGSLTNPLFWFVLAIALVLVLPLIGVK
jgi:hypothetical protein